MKKVNGLPLALFCILISTIGFGQKVFTDCSAAFLTSKMVVDSYTDQGKCLLSSSTTGELTVCTVNLSPTKSKAIDKIAFKIAIRDKDTQTILLYSNENFEQIAIERVLAKCKKGDHIILLTLDDKYAMPHNEILVQ